MRGRRSGSPSSAKRAYFLRAFFQALYSAWAAALPAAADVQRVADNFANARTMIERVLVADMRRAGTRHAGPLRYDHHEIVTPLRARNAMNAAAIAASIAPAANMRAIVALKLAARASFTTLRMASKPCADAAASARLNLI
jgi:hypothetical protein